MDYTDISVWINRGTDGATAICNKDEIIICIGSSAACFANDGHISGMWGFGDWPHEKCVDHIVKTVEMQTDPAFIKEFKEKYGHLLADISPAVAV